MLLKETLRKFYKIMADSTLLYIMRFRIISELFNAEKKVSHSGYTSQNCNRNDYTTKKLSIFSITDKNKRILHQMKRSFKYTTRWYIVKKYWQWQYILNTKRDPIAKWTQRTYKAGADDGHNYSKMSKILSCKPVIIWIFLFSTYEKSFIIINHTRSNNGYCYNNGIMWPCCLHDIQASNSRLHLIWTQITTASLFCILCTAFNLEPFFPFCVHIRELCTQWTSVCIVNLVWKREGTIEWNIYYLLLAFIC